MKNIVIAVLASAVSFGALAQMAKPAPAMAASAPMAKSMGSEMKKDTAKPMAKKHAAKKHAKKATAPAA